MHLSMLIVNKRRIGAFDALPDYLIEVRRPHRAALFLTIASVTADNSLTRRPERRRSDAGKLIAVAARNAAHSLLAGGHGQFARGWARRFSEAPRCAPAPLRRRRILLGWLRRNVTRLCGAALHSDAL